MSLSVLKHQSALDFAPAPQTLASFVAGRDGAALAAVTDFAALSGAERCVYLWGESGSGRTHLLRAAVAAATAAGKVAVLADPRALAQAGLADAALVAVDDVHELDPAAQAVLFDLFNALRWSDGRLLAAGDRAPRDLIVREDLRTRLGSGLAFELHPLSDAERITALRTHAARRGLVLEDAVVDYLLARVPRDLGTLTMLVDLIDRASLEQQRAVTLPLVRAVLQQHRQDATPA